jgi:hypothetical protein
MCREKWGDFCFKFWWILGIENLNKQALDFWHLAIYYSQQGWVLGHIIPQKFLHNNTPEEFSVRFPTLLFWKENGGERNLLKYFMYWKSSFHGTFCALPPYPSLGYHPGSRD